LKAADIGEELGCDEAHVVVVAQGAREHFTLYERGACGCFRR